MSNIAHQQTACQGKQEPGPPFLHSRLQQSPSHPAVTSMSTPRLHSECVLRLPVLSTHSGPTPPIAQAPAPPSLFLADPHHHTTNPLFRPRDHTACASHHPPPVPLTLVLVRLPGVCHGGCRAEHADALAAGLFEQLVDGGVELWAELLLKGGCQERPGEAGVLCVCMCGWGGQYVFGWQGAG